MRHPTIIDTHAHLDDRKYARDLDAVLKRATESGVDRIVTIGTDLETSRAGVDLAAQHEEVFAAVGIHPHYAADADDAALDQIGLLVAARGKVVAIGEAGLDFYRDLSPRGRQKEVFRRQIEIAIDARLPFVLHNRDATRECLAILDEYRGNCLRGVAHCFGGDKNAARRFLDLGFYISFAGTVTFPNARKVKEVAQFVPVDRLVLETDCPYLAPQPVRGKRNEPAFVRYMLYEIAGLRGMTSEDLARATTTNAEELFGIKPGAGV